MESLWWLLSLLSFATVGTDIQQLRLLYLVKVEGLGGKWLEAHELCSQQRFEAYLERFGGEVEESRESVEARVYMVLGFGSLSSGRDGLGGRWG
jgi:hypothetical protein